MLAALDAEPPDEDELDALESDELVLLDELLLVLLDVLPEDFLLEPPAYRSAYQPPPFKMKLPDWIWRLARACPHSGQSFSGSSVMR